MNRRTLFKRGALALLALPFASLFRPRKPTSVGYSTTSVNLQEKAFRADDLNVDDLRGVSMDSALVIATDHINLLLKTFVDECRRDRALPDSAELLWVNIPHQTENPEGKLGYFRLAGRRWSPNDRSRQLLWPRLGDAPEVTPIVIQPTRL